MPAKWAPRDFVSLAACQPLAELARDSGASFVLVVPVGEGSSELAAQDTGSSAAPARAGGLGFRTLQGDAAGALSAMRREGKLAMPRHVWDVPGSYVPIPRKLLESVCQVIPISKRSFSSFLERISVGRVQSHDVVLRHPSVSKFHGWFEVQQDGQLYLGDAGSLNSTYVNDARVTGRVRVQPGARVRFGLLETHVFTLESFWMALRPST